MRDGEIDRNVLQLSQICRILVPPGSKACFPTFVGENRKESCSRGNEERATKILIFGPGLVEKIPLGVQELEVHDGRYR